MHFFSHLTKDQEVAIVIVLGCSLIAIRIVDAVLRSKEDK